MIVTVESLSKNYRELYYAYHRVTAFKLNARRVRKTDESGKGSLDEITDDMVHGTCSKMHELCSESMNASQKVAILRTRAALNWIAATWTRILRHITLGFKSEKHPSPDRTRSGH